MDVMERKARAKELIRIIQEYKELIAPYQEELFELIQDCEHEAVRSTNSSDSGRCHICQESTDWYCPDAPNHICDYEQEDGEYDEDSCRHCGQPEERK